MTILVLAHSRILQRKEVLSFSTNINQGGSWEELNAGATEGAGAGAATPPVMPSSTPSVSTGTSTHFKHPRSSAWNNFDEIFETLPNGKKVRVAAKCRHCSHVLSG